MPVEYRWPDEGSTYGGLFDVSRMRQVNVLEEVEQALQGVVLPLAMVLVFPTGREETKLVGPVRQPPSFRGSSEC